MIIYTYKKKQLKMHKMFINFYLEKTSRRRHTLFRVYLSYELCIAASFFSAVAHPV